jgi:hypothetical protein
MFIFNTKELYIDTDLECYNALQYKRYSYLDLMMSMMSTKWLEIFKQVYFSWKNSQKNRLF